LDKRLLLLVVGIVMLIYGFVFIVIPFPELQLVGFPLFSCGDVILAVVGLNFAVRKSQESGDDGVS